MDRKIALRWARALESGKYHQVQGALRSDDNGFCCLGVLCNLHAEAHPKIAAEETDPCSYLGKQATLPQEVIEWAGMNGSDNGGFSDNFQLEVEGHIKVARDMVTLNDDLELDFNQIAAVIRKHSDKL